MPFTNPNEQNKVIPKKKIKTKKNNSNSNLNCLEIDTCSRVPFAFTSKNMEFRQEQNIENTTPFLNCKDNDLPNSNFYENGLMGKMPFSVPNTVKHKAENNITYNNGYLPAFNQNVIS